jgi:hypothetical protein
MCLAQQEALSFKQEENMVTNSGKTVVDFVYEKDTPGTYRYQEMDSTTGHILTANNGAIIGPLYIRKSRMPIKLKKLRLEITGEE